MGYHVFVVSPNHVILDTGGIPIAPKMTESVCVKESIDQKHAVLHGKSLSALTASNKN